jgi:hypothetical protein
MLTDKQINKIKVLNLITTSLNQSVMFINGRDTNYRCYWTFISLQNLDSDRLFILSYLHFLKYNKSHEFLFSSKSKIHLKSYRQSINFVCSGYKLRLNFKD